MALTLSVSTVTLCVVVLTCGVTDLTLSIGDGTLSVGGVAAGVIDDILGVASGVSGVKLDRFSVGDDALGIGSDISLAFGDRHHHTPVSVFALGKRTNLLGNISLGLWGMLVRLVEHPTQTRLLLMSFGAQLTFHKLFTIRTFLEFLSYAIEQHFSALSEIYSPTSISTLLSTEPVKVQRFQKIFLQNL